MIFCVIQPVLSFVATVNWRHISVYEKLQGKQWGDPLTFCSICVQTPFTLTLRIWDIYILEGERLLPAMSYTILKLHKSKHVLLHTVVTAGVRLSNTKKKGLLMCVCLPQSTWWSCPWRTWWSFCRRHCPKISSSRTTLWSSSFRRPWRSSGGRSWNCLHQVLIQRDTHGHFTATIIQRRDTSDRLLVLWWHDSNRTTEKHLWSKILLFLFIIIFKSDPKFQNW